MSNLPQLPKPASPKRLVCPKAPQKKKRGPENPITKNKLFSKRDASKELFDLFQRCCYTDCNDFMDVLEDLNFIENEVKSTRKLIVSVLRTKFFNHKNNRLAEKTADNNMKTIQETTEIENISEIIHLLGKFKD
jgi:hypothetical protein